MWNNRDAECRKFDDCEECVAQFNCEWNLRDHMCGYVFKEPRVPRSRVATFEGECPGYVYAGAIAGQIIGILISLAIVVAILLCIVKNRRRNRRFRNMQVTTGQVMTVQTQQVPQPQPEMAMPMNTVHPPQYHHHQQQQPQMGQRMMGQMQYQPDPPQMAAPPMMQNVPNAFQSFEDDGGEGMEEVHGNYTNQ